MAENLGELTPETMKHYMAMNQSIVEQSDLDEKTIELITLGYSIANQCEHCITMHVKKLVELGVTENEIATVAALATAMGGGPGSAQAIVTLNIYNKYKKD